MLYNFRFDRDQKSLILDRLSSERELSQGWGGGSAGGLDLRDSDFVARVKDRYELTATNIASNLSRMRELRDGDLIVTPHLPRYGVVSIHVVEGDFPDCYRYKEDDPTHLNHRIRIADSVGLDGSISAGAEQLIRWKAKLPWMRLPILPKPAFEDDFRSILRAKRSAPELRFKKSEVEHLLDSLRTRLLDLVANELENIPPVGTGISFERVCERVLKAAGYEIRDRHQYDGKGGDIDLHCVRAREDVSPFESGESHLLVQAKKHSGETDETAVRQLLAMADEEVGADLCVMTLGDSLSEDAEELARLNGVVLLTRSQICSMVLRDLATGLEEE